MRESAVGVAQLPLGVAVEVDQAFEIALILSPPIVFGATQAAERPKLRW